MKKFLLLILVFSFTSYFAQEDKEYSYVIKLKSGAVSSNNKVVNNNPEKDIKAYFADASSFNQSSGLFTIITKTELKPYDFALLMESKGIVVDYIEKVSGPTSGNLEKAFFYYKPASRDTKRVKQ